MHLVNETQAQTERLVNENGTVGKRNCSSKRNAFSVCKGTLYTKSHTGKKSKLPLAFLASVAFSVSVRLQTENALSVPFPFMNRSISVYLSFCFRLLTVPFALAFVHEVY